MSADFWSAVATGLVPVGAASFLTWIVFAVARRHAVDVPNERSSHSTPTPRSGGIAIIATVFLLGFGAESLWIWPSVVAALLVGLWDDVRSLRPRTKMIWLAAAAVTLALNESVRVVRGVPFAGELDLAWAALPLTVFWLACYPNAFNFMDGLNGIATLTALVSSGVLCFAFVRHSGWLPPGGQTTIALLTTLGCAGFLPWNFPKARIFLGDAGSLPLGLILAWLAVRANATGAMSFPASVLLLGPFLFDVTFTLVKRKREGKVIGEAHKEHLYQRLSRVFGGSHAKSALVYAGMSVATGVLALAYDSMSDVAKLVSLVLPVAAMLGFAALVRAAETRQAASGER